jgi:hypothetical protein
MNASASDSQIREYERRPKRYRNIDGTLEMFMGALYLGGWLAAEFETLFPAGSFGKILAGGTIVSMAVLATIGIGLIKKRITVPRTGYVTPRKPAKSALAARAVAYLASVAAIPLLFGLMRRHHAFESAQVFMLAVLAVPYVVSALTAFKDHPWKAAVAFALILGLAGFAVTAGPNAQFIHPALLITGLVWLASGAITLLLYIRRTHPPEPEAQ